MKHSYIGIDGCKFGWIAVEIMDEANFNFNLVKNISAIEKWENAQVLIDIPIGLGDKFIERNVDYEAKKLLSPYKKSSIFMPPCRDAVYAENYEKAKSINQKITGKSISIQAWNICNKIKEIDQFLISTPQKRPYLQEAHPEICFTILNGGKSFSSKKSTPIGQTERLELLKLNFKNAEHIYNKVIDSTLRKDVKKDDILDAMVLAIAAFKTKNKKATLLQNTPKEDSKGIRISLWINQ